MLLGGGGAYRVSFLEQSCCIVRAIMYIWLIILCEYTVGQPSRASFSGFDSSKFSEIFNNTPHDQFSSRSSQNYFQALSFPAHALFNLTFKTFPLYWSFKFLNFLFILDYKYQYNLFK